jgi:shikimate 5-dehydrogenase
MLISQAAASFRLWTGREMDVEAAMRAARAALGLPPPGSPDP